MNKKKTGKVLSTISLIGILVHIIILGILQFQTGGGVPGENVIWGMLFILYMLLLPILMLGCLVLSIMGIVYTRNSVSILALVCSILQVIIVVFVYFNYIV